MTNTSFPDDKNPQKEESSHCVTNEKHVYITPQFEIIDDRAQTRSHKEEAKQNKTQKNPLSLRFICFLGLIFCSIFGLGMFLMSLVTTVIAASSLFTNPSLNASVRGFWKLFIHTLIAGFGFVLGIASPTVGLGLIALYISIKGEMIDSSLLYSIIKRSFNKF